eukprot:4360402-Alexandrium_andersonii.AAC.1
MCIRDSCWSHRCRFSRGVAVPRAGRVGARPRRRACHHRLRRAQDQWGGAGLPLALRRLEACRHPLGPQRRLRSFSPVSYTHLTLPTICSV